MIVLREKEYSVGGQMVYKLYNKIEMPKDFVNIPKIIKNYIKSGISEDFYRLLEEMNLLEFCPLPICCFGGKQEKNKYFPCFSYDLDSLDLGQFVIYFDLEGKLYKKTGILFYSYKEISDSEFKNWLLERLDCVINDDWVEDQGKILAKNSNLINRIKNKIGKL